MKKLSILFVIFALLLCACSSEPTVVTSDGPDSFNLTADNYTGTEFKELVAEESSEITVTIDANVKKGSVNFYCINSENVQVYEYSFQTGGSYNIRLSGPDTYKLNLDCKGFTGDCSLSWEIIGAVASTEETPEVVVIDPNAIQFP